MVDTEERRRRVVDAMYRAHPIQLPHGAKFDSLAAVEAEIDGNTRVSPWSVTVLQELRNRAFVIADAIIAALEPDLKTDG